MNAHIVFTNFGCELLGFEAISSALKKANHRVSLVYDPGLFDDRVYFRNKLLAYFFNITHKTIEDIVKLKPDIVGMYVISDTYRWCRYVARKIKQKLDIPILVGGTLPSGLPEKIICEDWVDIACIGDGVTPTVKLMNSIANGKIDTGIENLWFKTNGGSIVKNNRSAPMNINEEQVYDKSLFENHIAMNNCYMTVFSKGCPWRCSYCSQSYLQPLYSSSGHYCEWREIENIIDELKTMKARYNFREIDFRDNTFITNPKKTKVFLNRFIEEIGVLPFKVMTHPSTITLELANLLKKAGCFKIQFGVQTVNEKIRTQVLKRQGTNEQLLKGLIACDEAGLKYSIDHIFNLPNDTEEDQIEAALIYSKCKNVSRITCFWLSYFPGTEIVNIATDLGVLSDEDVKRINSLEPDGFYLDTGILNDKKRIRMFNRYHILFRAIPILPSKMVFLILKLNLHYLLNFVPKALALWIIDILVTVFGRDREGMSYLKSNWFQIRRVFKYAIWGNYRLARKDFIELFNVKTEGR